MKNRWTVIALWFVALSPAVTVGGGGWPEDRRAKESTLLPLACPEDSTLERPPAWFRSVGSTWVFGAVNDLAGEDRGLDLGHDDLCAGGEVELEVLLGFCPELTWPRARLDLRLGPPETISVLSGSLEVRTSDGTRFDPLPATLQWGEKEHDLVAGAFDLTDYRDPVTGEVSVLLSVVAQGSCGNELGGDGVSVRSVDLGVPTGD
ncbi:MAG: hypothetical protein AAF481_19255 [Acidobacteriota bacterium]